MSQQTASATEQGTPAEAPAVRLIGITKRFPGVVANNNLFWTNMTMSF